MGCPPHLKRQMTEMENSEGRPKKMNLGRGFTALAPVFFLPALAQKINRFPLDTRKKNRSGGEVKTLSPVESGGGLSEKPIKHRKKRVFFLSPTRPPPNPEKKLRQLFPLRSAFQKGGPLIFGLGKKKPIGKKSRSPTCDSNDRAKKNLLTQKHTNKPHTYTLKPPFHTETQNQVGVLAKLGFVFSGGPRKTGIYFFCF